MKNESIPTRPNQSCPSCNRLFNYYPNPDWGKIQHLLKSTQARQNSYWLIIGHEECVEKEKRDEQTEANKIRNQMQRATTKRIMQGLGFAGYVHELTAEKRELIINKDNQRAHDALKKWSGMQKTGILLYGGPGRGKTSLMANFAAEWNSQGMPVGFINVTKLLAVLRQGYDDNTHDERLQFISSQIQVLILDDLGAEKPTEWAQEKIYMLINDRLTRELPVFITTNCGLQSGTQEMTEKLLLEKFHPRLVSRLKEMCDWVKVDGPDWRDQINKNRQQAQTPLDKLGLSEKSFSFESNFESPLERDLRKRASDWRI